MRKRLCYASAAIATAFVFAGCSGAANELRKQDPDGYAACEALSNARASSDTEETLNNMLKAGEHASKSNTPEIQAANEEDSALADLGFPLADSDVLIDACETHGYKIADVNETSGD